MMTKKKTGINKPMDYRLKAIYEQMLLGEKGEKKPVLYYALPELNFVTREGYSIPNPESLDLNDIYVKVPKDSQPESSLPVDEEDSQEAIEPKRMFDGDSNSKQRRLTRLIKKFVNVPREEWPKITNPYFYFKAASVSEILPLKNLIKNFGHPAASRINQGHASEAILGATLYCKFKNPESKLNIVEEVVPVLFNALKKTIREEPTTYTKFDKSSAPIQDKIVYKLILDETTTRLLKIMCKEIIEKKSVEFKQEFIEQNSLDERNLKTIISLFDSCVKYTNTNSAVANKIKTVMNDGQAGLLEVESTGGDATTQDSTKVDLLTTYTVANQPPRTNLLRLSMKAGAVTQFGQVSGGAFVKYKTFFESMFGKEFFANLQPPSPGEGTRKFYKTKEDEDFNWSEKENNWFKSYAEQTRAAQWPDVDIKNFNFGEPLQWLYSQIVQQFNLKFANATPDQKINFVKQIYRGIKYHATLEADDVVVDKSKVTPDVELLILNPSKGKQYTQLGFGSFFFEEMQKYTFEAKLENSTSTTKTIKLFAKPIASSEPKTLSQAYSSVSKPQKKPKINLKGENLFFLQLRSNKASFRNRIEMGPFLKELADIQKQEQAELEKQKQAQPLATEPKTF